MILQKRQRKGIVPVQLFFRELLDAAKQQIKDGELALEPLRETILCEGISCRRKPAVIRERYKDYLSRTG